MHHNVSCCILNGIVNQSVEEKTTTELYELQKHPDILLIGGYEKMKIVVFLKLKSHGRKIMSARLIDRQPWQGASVSLSLRLLAAPLSSLFRAAGPLN